MIIIITLLIFLPIIIYTCIMVNYKCYKFYKETYNILKSGDMNLLVKDDKFILLNNNVNISLLDLKTYDSTIVFFNDGSIKLYGCNEYLVNAFYTWLDPYSFYWLIKINNLNKF